MDGGPCGEGELGEWFGGALDFVSTREGFLNVLGTFIRLLEARCGGEVARGVLRRVLSTPVVAGRVAFYVGSLAEVSEKLRSDPHYRDLWAYRGEVLEGLYGGLVDYYRGLLGVGGAGPGDALFAGEGEPLVERLAGWLVECSQAGGSGLEYHERLLAGLSLLILGVERATGWSREASRRVVEQVARHPRVIGLWRRLAGLYARFYRLMHVGPYSITAAYRYEITQPIREALPRLPPPPTRRGDAVGEEASWEPPSSPGRAPAAVGEEGEVRVRMGAPRSRRHRGRRGRGEAKQGRQGGSRARVVAVLVLLALAAGLLLYLLGEGPVFRSNLYQYLEVLRGFLDRLLEGAGKGPPGGTVGEPSGGGGSGAVNAS